jgi:hypothetical protein
MKRFLQSLAGSFVGRFVAVLVIAVLAAVGLGPDRWAAWLLGLSINSALIARVILLLAAAIMSGLLVTAIIVSRTSGIINVQQRWPLRRVWRRLRVASKKLKRRMVRFWLVFGPRNYELPREVAAIGLPYYPAYKESQIEFSHRFSDAFPGTRDLLVLENPTEIIRRLDVLLRWPLTAWAKNADMGATPFYWTYGMGHMHIYRYHRYKRQVVLINEMELRPRYLAAIPGRAYWQNYVYLESERLPWLSIRGEEHYAPGKYQEYAIHNGRLFNRSEYDDGGYMLRGKPVRFSHNPDLHSRRAEPFGFLITASTSPANRPEVDQTIEQLIERVVTDKSCISLLTQFLLSLPKREQP